MNGVWFFDGKDLGSFGVGLVVGSYGSLLCYAESKEPDTNDWAEYNGVEVDLSNLYFKERKVTLSFGYVKNANIDGFIRLVTSAGYHVFRSATLGKEWRLRYNTDSNLFISVEGGMFSIDFIDDFPLALFDITANSVDSGMVPEQEYSIDGISLKEYSIGVRNGKDSVMATGTVRSALTRSFADKSGLDYDAELVKLEKRDLRLSVGFVCGNMKDFWNNYISFFNLLKSPGERSLMATKYSTSEYFCYYKSCSDFKFLKSSDIIGALFDITFVLTDKLSETYLMTDENEFLINKGQRVKVIIER